MCGIVSGKIIFFIICMYKDYDYQKSKLRDWLNLCVLYIVFINEIIFSHTFNCITIVLMQLNRKEEE